MKDRKPASLERSQARLDALRPTQRFEARAEAYAAARPSYPVALGLTLREHLFARDEHREHRRMRGADLGAGTGLASQRLLEAGMEVIAVDPSEAMLELARRAYGHHENFQARCARAEATGLPAASVDAVVAAQAFHWFDVDAFAKEARRIAVEGARAAIIWNQRRLDGSAFLRAYEAIAKRWGRDYEQVAARYAQRPALERFFGGLESEASGPDASFEQHVLEHRQRLDRAGLLARLASCSYLPGEGEAGFEAMRAAADLAFDTHARSSEFGSFIEIEYDCEIFVGSLR